MMSGRAFLPSGPTPDQPASRKAASISPELPPAFSAVRQTVSAPGQPLPLQVRRQLEPRFGHDFSRVRIHTDAQAAASARAVNAAAYTVGQHVTFGEGRYAPRSEAGRRLLAHELAHTIQQHSVPGLDRVPFRIDPPRSRREREADDAASRVLAGEAVSVRPAPEPAGVALLQRAEHGTYISTLGDAQYLDAAERFYRSWGHPNVRRVATVQQAVTDLNARVPTGTLDRFRIVAHGNTGGVMQIGLMPGLSPELFDNTSVTFRDEARFRTDLASMVLIDDALVTLLFNALRADATTDPLLTTIGFGPGVPAADTTLGILLRAILETHWLASVRLPTGGVPNIRNRTVLGQFNSRRITAYGRAVAQAAANPQAVQQAVTRLIATAPAALQSAGISLAPLDPSAQATLADPFLDPNSTTGRINPRITTDIEEGAGGPFVRALRTLRAKVRTSTHVEIRGCNVGQSTAFLDSVRAFFGDPANLPSVSAPDLFQYFFQLSFAAYGGSQAEQARLTTDIQDPTLSLVASFDEATRIRNGEMVKVVNDRTLADLARRYSLGSEQRLRNLNPEIDPNALTPGQTIWRVVRPRMPAGFFTGLETFCQEVLGNRHLWPRIWGNNPHLTQPTLSPTDHIDLPGNIGVPLAAPALTQADYRAALAAGQAMVAVDPTDNRPRARLLNDAQRAQAIAAWLARQRFDPRGRTAQVLGQLYAGGRFQTQMRNTHIALLSRGYPNIVDPIFPDDPRHDAHIIRRP